MNQETTKATQTKRRNRKRAKTLRNEERTNIEMTREQKNQKATNDHRFDNRTEEY